MELNLSQRKKIVETILKKYPDVIVIYLYGSFATGRATEQSDVDIAFLTPHEINVDKMACWELAQEIANKIHHEVDLVSLNSASTVFRFVILQTQKLLYSASESERERFETLVYSMYLRFNEERKLILQEIQKRGEIY